MLSPNPTSGIYEADTSRTLDTSVPDPNKNAGGMAIVVFDGKQVTSKTNRSNPQPNAPCHTLASGSADSAIVALEGNGSRPSHKGSGISEDGTSFCLNTIERHAVAYQDKVGALCASDYKFPQSQQIEEGKAVVEQHTFGKNGFGRWNDESATLKAKGGDFPGGENMVVENHYVVRRLTPSECALLQGFPPDWCAGLDTPEPTEDDIAFWSEVWETHRRVISKSSKPKSRAQIVKWLQNPHSDSKEYAMWGNGICLNCGIFVLGGIVYYAS